MATSSAEEKQEHAGCTTPEEDDQDEEALSLCDLPVYRTKEESNQSSRHQETETYQEDFEFGPWGGDGYLSKKSDMCAADDIFFQGQILPLRLSASSESDVHKFERDSSLNQSHCLSRSVSTDHNSISVFTTFSCSSSRSHYSSSSSSSSTSPAIASTRMIKPKVQNQFLTHPSPKPQIRLPSTSLRNAACSRPRNSSFWDFFRLGLVRTPWIELQDLKVRNSVSRNSSSGSSKSNPSIKKRGKISVSSKSGCKIKNMSRHNSSDRGKNMEKRRKQSLLQKRRGLLSGCSCSVSAVKPVPLNVDVFKSSNSRSRRAGNGNNDKSERGSIEEKLRELKMKKRIVEKQQQGKQDMSRHRAFEWIKELPHATYHDHQKEAI
ncbi:hypothetical protein OIU84_005890 [Salix udensis]|uniref:Uncharacterized protein n=1 Tax=Salix udensis TaxID=889485 RepID=A0AAD6P1J7_9ROSI|nr:hypothetical protein OIU84_005890 [Salix udensis]